MPVYKRCRKCYKDNALSVRHCGKCKTVLKGKYCVRVKDTVTGKWLTKITPSLKNAQEVEQKFKVGGFAELAPNKPKDNPYVSFEAYMESAKFSKKTWKDDEQRWKKHIAGKGHNTKRGVLKIMREMAESALYQPATIEHVLKLIRRVYNWHRSVYGWPIGNPCDGIKLPKYDNRINNPLSISEAGKLIDYLKHMDNQRVALIVLFALFTGRRKGEILSLKWSDVNFDLEIITCRNTKNGSSLSFPLNATALKALYGARALRISEYVFPSRSGSYYIRSFNHAWERLRIRLLAEGVLDGHIRFHDLRHTYATHLASSGKVDIYTLKKLLGHKDISLTERYAHLIDRRLRECTSVQDSLY